MRTFGEKVKAARMDMGLSQAELAEEVGVTTRSIQTYEQGSKLPRAGTLMRLAKTLGVSVKFLTDNECEDPTAEIERDGYIEKARAMYGAKGGRELDQLLRANMALFSGSEFSEEQKDSFFRAVMTAYVHYKEGARKKYGHENWG